MAIKRSSDSSTPPSKTTVSKPTSQPPQNTSNLEPELMQPQANPEEESNEDKIRPQKLADYIGQKDLKGILNIAIAAAKGRQDSLDHLLLYGPPGLGKTTMSLILATEMGVNCKITSAPALERPRDITGLLVNLQPGDILFIDEIHRLNRMTEELLYSAMEDFRLDITIGKGQTAKTRSIKLPDFTLVGATTKAGSLSSPLRDRFGIIQRLRFYEFRSRGTPRIANRLLRRVRDYVEVQKAEEITTELAAMAMDLFDVDREGLDWTDRLVLNTIIEQFNGGPAGLEAIAAATGEDRKTIEEVYEPYLLQNGYLNRTHRGRTVTAKTYKHLGLPGNGAGTLF